MKTRFIRSLFVLAILCAILLTSCIGEKQFTNVNNTEITATRSGDKEIITSENLGQIRIVETWGQGNVYGVTLSPDEKTIAVATTTGVYLYDSKTLEQKQFIGLPIVGKTNLEFRPKNIISFSPDGNFLAIGYNGILIWNMSNMEYEGRIDNRIADFNAVQIAYNPDGNTIAVMSMGLYGPCDAWGGNFALYDVNSKSILYNDYFCPESSLFHFTFTNNGNVVFVGRYRESSVWINRASIVDSNLGTLQKTLSFDGYIDSINSDGSLMSVRPLNSSITSDSTEIIDTNSYQVIDQVDGILLYLPGSNNHQLIVNEKEWTVTSSDQKSICKFHVSPNVYFDVYRTPIDITGDYLVFWNSYNQHVEIWDMSNCQLSKQLFIPVGNNSIKYSSDGEYLATNDWSYIHLWDGKTGEHVHSIPGRYNTLPSQFYDFGNYGKTIVSVSTDNPYNINFWDLPSGNRIRTITTDHESGFYVSFNSDRTRIATLDLEGAHLWDTEKGTLIKTIPGNFNEIYFNPSGDNFALIDDSKIVFRNAESAEIEYEISISKRSLGVVFSNDWTFMAIAGHEQIELWNMDGTKIRMFEEYIPINFYDDYYGTESIYMDFAFSPDNNLLAAIRYDYNDSIIRLWDTSTGRILRDINIPFMISKLVFNPDGMAITTLGDGVINQWGILK